MIVRPFARAIQLITQPDHARLAGRIMSHAVPLADHPRRDAVLLAVAEHDNGWEEEDAEPRVDDATGSVVDFVGAPAPVRQRVWPRAVERLASHPWAAALVAQHAVTVYDRFRQDASWSSFFHTMEAMRDRLLGTTALSVEQLLDDYRFVRLGDLVSLTFCTGWTETQHYADWAVRLDGTQVIVTPDPFDGEVPIEVVAREVRSDRFASESAVREALLDAAVIWLRGCVRGERA